MCSDSLSCIQKAVWTVLYCFVFCMTSKYNKLKIGSVGSLISIYELQYEGNSPLWNFSNVYILHTKVYLKKKIRCFGPFKSVSLNSGSGVILHILEFPLLPHLMPQPLLLINRPFWAEQAVLGQGKHYRIHSCSVCFLSATFITL